MLEGLCQVQREDNVEFILNAGDFMLMASPPHWTMSAGSGAEPLDFKAVVENPRLLQASEGDRSVTRFFAGSFTFAPANRDLIATLMRPIVRVPGHEAAANRFGSLLNALGDEALADRPGRSIVLDRLLEVVLVEALRFCPPDRENERGLMAGLMDPKIGRALRVMHAETKRPWTLASLAREIGMSRSAFAARFLQIVGIPPIEYLANWRMTVAKDALASALPMSEVAEMAGFQSVSAFSTAFKRQTGYPPTVYLRSLGQTLASP
jgi:AraC-like DNA-binding protein